jgi:branched-chain amino acid transport system substrate-binding protein
LNKKAIAIIVIALIAISGAAVYSVERSGSSTSSSTNSPYYIGVLDPLTGADGPGGGLDNEQGIQIAANMTGTINGHPIKLVVGDTTTNAPQAVTETQKLITLDGCQDIIGCYGTAEAQAVAQTVAKYNVTYLETTGWDVSLASYNDSKYFQLCQNSNYYATTYADSLASFFPTAMNISVANLRVAVVYDTWADYVVNPMLTELKVQGITPVFTSQNPWNIADFTPIIEQLKPLKIDVLVVEMIPNSAILFRTQMLSLGFNPKAIYAMGVGWEEQSFETGVGAAKAEGIFDWSWPSPQINTPTAHAFTKAFEAAYGVAPDVHAFAGYSGAMFLFDMIKKAGTLNPDKVAAEIRAQNIRAGVEPNTWGIKFVNGANTGATTNLISQWQTGTLSPVYPSSYAVTKWEPTW